MFTGFVPIRRGILEHIRSGDLPHKEALAYVIIILEADCETGIWRGSAKALGPYNYSNRAARHILHKLHQKGYIKSFCRQGRRGNYIVLVNKFQITRGKWKGKQLDATNTLNPKELVFRVEVNSHEDGHESAPSQEGEGKRRMRKERAATQPPHPLHDEIRKWLAEQWERRFGRKPPWDGRDNKALKELLAARPDVTLTEVQAAWKNYMASTKKFYDDNGWPLWALCKDFAGLSLHPVHDRGGQHGAPTRGKSNGTDHDERLARYREAGKSAKELAQRAH
jgi:hypothetical protein